MITVAIQKGNYVQIFNEKNYLIKNVYGTLYGYTANTYSIRKGNYIYTYDEKGHMLSQKYSKEG
ncbi:MAG: hypothetical protein IJS58_04835 [Bacilli bacterium]|nr:hypothetical protein [Bacilli bacterium]